MRLASLIGPQPVFPSLAMVTLSAASSFAGTPSLPTAPPASAQSASSGDASYIDASVRVDGLILDWAFVDVDLDGKDELALSTRTPRGERELRLHRMGPKSVDPKPYATIPILKDIVAWTFADVRADLEGRELILLTRQGAWSFDPRKKGYKGNIQRLLEVQLLYDVPSPRALPYWSYVLKSKAKGGERLLLPDRTGFKTYGPNPQAKEGELPWHALATFRRTNGSTPADPSDQERRKREAKLEGDRKQARFSVTVGEGNRPFLGSGATSSLIEDDFRIQAPALFDVNGDGRRDMLLIDGDRLNVHIANAAGIPERPTRVEPLPDYLEQDGRRAALRVVDIDGDGTKDVLGIWSEDIEGFENAQWRIYVMRSTKTRLLPEKPTQVLRFKAAELRATVADVDGDGRPDLAIRRFELPTMLESVTGLEFKYAQLLYLGTNRGRFDKSPALRKESTFDEESVSSVLANRELVMDCSGDGIADLVEVNLSGELGVRRMRKDSSFFGGTTWEIDDGYWKRYASRGSVSSLTVRDLNRDRLGDIISASDSVLTIYLSQKR